MAEKTVREIGRFSGPGGSVPIIGCEALEFANQTKWNWNPAGVSSVAVSIWQGDDLTSFNFSFELFAGLPPIPDRATLHEKMRIMLSWAQHREGDKPLPPPPVRLMIPAHVSSIGVISEVNVTGKAPWETDGPPYPTTAHFQGVFVLLPGYDGNGTEIAAQNLKLSQESIAAKMFVV